MVHHSYKSHGVYIVPMSEREKVDLLCRRYGVNVVADEAASGSDGDVGTCGTLELPFK
jgi:adenosylmethionine-8-amino-7-oxononanoate aminotransferase